MKCKCYSSTNIVDAALTLTLKLRTTEPVVIDNRLLRCGNGWRYKKRSCTRKLLSAIQPMPVYHRNAKKATLI